MFFGELNWDKDSPDEVDKFLKRGIFITIRVVVTTTYSNTNYKSKTIEDSIDSSNNYSSIQKNLFISSDKNQNKLKETNLTMQPKLKTKNELISKDVLNQENDLDIHMNENI